MEDLVIDGIYADLLRGRLDQKLQQFEVEYAAGRDVAPQKLNSVLEALQDWYVYYQMSRKKENRETHEFFICIFLSTVTCFSEKRMSTLLRPSISLLNGS